MGAVAQLISGEEQRRLELFEVRIERGLGVFNDVGESLAAIRDERLYRGTHDRFEDYCSERWGMQRNYANKLIAASAVVRNLGTIVPILPITESQARPLTGLVPEIQREVWTKAVTTAPEGKVTAAHVERTLAQLHGVAAHRAGRARHQPEGEGDVPDTVTLRVARVVYLMTMGRWMTIEQIAEMTGLTDNGAWRMMNRLESSKYVPVTVYEGKWGILKVDAHDWPY